MYNLNARPRTRRGFSLVELSIVLVILGLLVGGVLSGQSLIRAAELRSVSTQINNYRSAVFSFRDKYFAIPGDMNNAFSFWSTNCAASAILCNGNGDGLYPSGGAQQEALMAWRHLSLAGLIEGNYTGSGTADAITVGTNVPATKLGTNGLAFRFVAVTLSGRNYIQFGSPTASSGNVWLDGPGMKASDAWNIDIKTDDGISSSGKMVAGQAVGASENCVSGATYAFAETTNSCRLFFEP